MSEMSIYTQDISVSVRELSLLYFSQAHSLHMGELFLSTRNVYINIYSSSSMFVCMIN